MCLFGICKVSGSLGKMISSKIVIRTNVNQVVTCTKYFCDVKNIKDQERKIVNQVGTMKVEPGWNQTPFGEFIEKTFIRRLEYIMESTTYLEQVRKGKAHMLEVQGQLYANNEMRRSILKELMEVNAQIKNCGFNKKKLPKLLAKEEELWNSHIKLDHEETFLSSKSIMAMKEFYESERMHTKFMYIVSAVATLIGSMITIAVTYLIRRQASTPQISNNTNVDDRNKKRNQGSYSNKTEERKDTNNQIETWGSYLKKQESYSKYSTNIK
ncbi:uncharacterized protein LOC142232081 [Haematobia irritans]|uniref:uncharacterized protein LOC142232081 n=1 Tax=Haematobia irritans TaxID=7368 RepID=UPI003F4FC7B6